jgi:hypothetical protein
MKSSISSARNAPKQTPLPASSTRCSRIRTIASTFTFASTGRNLVATDAPQVWSSTTSTNGATSLRTSLNGNFRIYSIESDRNVHDLMLAARTGSKWRRKKRTRRRWRKKCPSNPPGNRFPEIRANRSSEHDVNHRRDAKLVNISHFE